MNVKFSLTILASMMLAACSSGGDSGHQDKSKIESKPKEVAPKDVVPKEVTPKKEAPKDVLTGAAYLVNDMNLNYSRKALNNADDLSTIIVDGKPIVIGQLESIDEASHFESVNKYHTTASYEHLRVSYSLEPQADSLFAYNGHPTKEMPQIGNASYKGEFYTRGRFMGDKLGIIPGKAEFNVDFANKKVVGELVEFGYNVRPEQSAKIDIHAKLEGNQFLGTAKSAFFKENGEIEGRFYGPNAEEMGAIFTDKKDFIGVVAAKKEKK